MPATSSATDPLGLRPVRFSVIIPAYNEAARLTQTLAAVRDYLRSRNAPRDAEVILVDDGSTDATLQIAREAAQRWACEADAPPLVVLSHPSNRGKGFAVRQGMLIARGELRLMLDADLATPLTETAKLLAHLEHGYGVVIGSRDVHGAQIIHPQPFTRRLLASAFRAIRRSLLLPTLRDTQCGLKLFTAEAARSAFSDVRLDGWLFDCEVLVRAAAHGHRIAEVGVVWSEPGGSRVRPLWSAWAVLRDLLWLAVLARRLRRGG